MVDQKPKDYQDPFAGGGGGQTAPSTGDLGIPSGYKPPSHTGEYIPQATNPQELAESNYAGEGTQTGVLNEFGMPSVAPRYHTGDEWTLAPQDPANIENLQLRLIDAGLLNPKSVRLGAWDQTSANAYKSVLALANAQGGTKEDALSYLVTNPTLKQQQGAGATAPVRVANPANLRAGFQGAADTLTGGDLPSSEADAFVNYYAEQEMRSAAAQPGQVVEDPMTPQAYVQAHDQGAIHAYTGLSRYLEFLRLLGQSI